MSIQPQPKPDNPRVCLVRFLYHRDTRTLMNTFHVQQAAPWNLASMQQLATVMHTWWSSSFHNAVPVGVGLYQIQVRKLDPTEPLAYDLDISPDDPGLRVGTMEPGNVTLTISWRTGLAGRYFRGRLYVPCLVENDVASNDLVTSGYITVLAACAITLLTNLQAAAFTLTIFHPPHYPPKLLDNQFTDVTTAVLENIVDSQRKRLPGRGR